MDLYRCRYDTDNVCHAAWRDRSAPGAGTGSIGLLTGVGVSSILSHDSLSCPYRTGSASNQMYITYCWTLKMCSYTAGVVTCFDIERAHSSLHQLIE